MPGTTLVCTQTIVFITFSDAPVRCSSMTAAGEISKFAPRPTRTSISDRMVLSGTCERSMLRISPLATCGGGDSCANNDEPQTTAAEKIIVNTPDLMAIVPSKQLMHSTLFYCRSSAEGRAWWPVHGDRRAPAGIGATLTRLMHPV